MEVSSTFEDEQAQGMDAETYFNSIYNDTYSDVLKYVIIKTSHADQVDDILQNIYHNFYKRITRRGFRDLRVPKAFLIQLAKRELYRHYRRKAIKTEMETDIAGCTEQIDIDETAFAEMIENKETLNIVRGIAMQMPLLSYKSFVLFYFYDMPIADIAGQLDISPNNVKNRLWRARTAVRKGLKGDDYVK